jgi:hypothetical protein
MALRDREARAASDAVEEEAARERLEAEAAMAGMEWR